MHGIALSAFSLAQAQHHPDLTLHTPAPTLLLCRRSFFHCGLLVPCLEFCGSQVLAWRPEAGRGPGGAAAQHLVVQCLLFTHGVQRCASYRGSAASLSLQHGARMQLEQLKGLAGEVSPALAAFWTPVALRAWVVAAVEHLLPLIDRELEEW